MIAAEDDAIGEQIKSSEGNSNDRFNNSIDDEAAAAVN